MHRATETESRRVGALLTTASIAIASMAFATGCGANRQLSTSIKAYEHGNYRQAASRCDQIEEDEYNDKRQVRYLVYCGLAFYQIGRTDSAKEMLQVGHAMYRDGDRRWLKPGIVDELEKTLDAMKVDGGDLDGDLEPDADGTPATASRQVDDSEDE